MTGITITAIICITLIILCLGTNKKGGGKNG